MIMTLAQLGAADNQETKMSLYIKTIDAKPGDAPADMTPMPGRWYCGMTCHDASQQEPGGRVEAGEFMRYDGDGCWTNEAEDPDGSEPRPGDYDYLQEQI